MNRPRMSVFAVILGAFGVCLTACSQPPATPGARAAHERHEHFEALGKAFKALDDESKRAAPDAVRMARHVDEVADLAQRLPNWFPEGSGPWDGVKTHARPEIWTDPVSFSERARAFQNAAEKLRAAAPEGVAAMRARMGDVGAACGACHKAFREKD
ncbi:MAG: cytochrome c [Hyphomonadaceae bacterium]